MDDTCRSYTGTIPAPIIITIPSTAVAEATTTHKKFGLNIKSARCFKQRTTTTYAGIYTDAHAQAQANTIQAAVVW